MPVQARQAGSNGLPGGLFCVPVLVKDNFDTLGMAASAGSAALLDNFASRDAQQVSCSLIKLQGLCIKASLTFHEVTLASIAAAIRLCCCCTGFACEAARRHL